MIDDFAKMPKSEVPAYRYVKPLECAIPCVWITDPTKYHISISRVCAVNIII